jgi:hypothetical protein
LFCNVDGKSEASEVITNRTVSDRLEEVHMLEVDRVERMIMKLLHELEGVVEKLSHILTQSKVIVSTLLSIHNSGGATDTISGVEFVDGNDVDRTVSLSPSVLNSNSPMKNKQPTRVVKRNTTSKKIEGGDVTADEYEVLQDVCEMFSVELWRKEKVYIPLGISETVSDEAQPHP